jgi:hypothetical protein
MEFVSANIISLRDNLCQTLFAKTTALDKKINQVHRASVGSRKRPEYVSKDLMHGSNHNGKSEIEKEVELKR